MTNDCTIFFFCQSVCIRGYHDASLHFRWLGKVTRF